MNTCLTLKESIKKTLNIMVCKLYINITITAYNKEELCEKTLQFYDMIQEIKHETQYNYILLPYMNKKWSKKKIFAVNNYNSEWKLLAIKVSEIDNNPSLRKYSPFVQMSNFTINDI